MESDAIPPDDLLPEGAADAPAGDGMAGADDLRATFPVVGIGASAGGLKAFQEFFSALPAQPDMAFVLVQHLSPDHESVLAELVQTQTQMKVTQVADHPDVEPNRVYVIPPGKHLEISGGTLHLVDPVDRHGRPLAVDRFFRTLAEDLGERAVCVVLSGTGSDGALGLKAVKERAGLTMAQDPDSAAYDGMPRSAVSTGLVDFTGTAAELASKLVEVRQAGRLVELVPSEADAPVGDEQALQAIFAHLRQRTGYDFTDYKRSTIRRRLARRLQVNGFRSLAEYAGFLRSNAPEVQALLRDFLISVTQFFRDPEAFEALEREAIPKLFEGKGRGDSVRVWVPGCATGEEAYSVAILLCEYAQGLADPPELQVFATDIDDDALLQAREGVYPAAAMGDLTPDRLRRFFEEVGGGIRVKEEIREILLFARHNLIADPPFSRLDLISCRNVLIYLNRAIQERVFSAFHYGLRADGYLFLGSSEGPKPLARGFTELDKSSRLYRRRDVQLGPPRMTLAPSEPVTAREAASTSRDPRPEGLVERYRDWSLEAYAPPRVLVDERGEVTHLFGRAGAYLRDREGPATHSVTDKVLRAFRVDLRAALYRAFAKGEPTDTAFREVTVEGERRYVRLHVGVPGGKAAQDGLAEVVFVELDPASVASLGVPIVDGTDGHSEDPMVARLEDELVRVRERLQATVEEQETSNEELKASNEELQSMNEELQSTTEELETSKEELQSMNEELHTLNQELKIKVEELTRANADLQNLIASTEIATVFLDKQLRVQRYTPAASGLFNLLPADLGRPLEHVTHRLQVGDLPGMARRVLDTLVPVEEDVRGAEGGGYVLRVLPYRTPDDRIEGVVITVVDVSVQRVAQEEALRRVRQQEAVAQLGQFALGGADTQAVFDRAVALVTDAVGAPLAKVLRHEPAAGHLRMVAGVGWADGAVGEATVPDARASQAGFTLLAKSPVIVPDLETETRFTGPPLLLEAGVRSGMSVPISGFENGPWGVLGVHACEPRQFTDIDGRFLESMAGVLATAIRRHENEGTIRDQLAEIEAVYATAPVGLAFMGRDLRYRRINHRLAAINGRPVEDHIGRRTSEVLPVIGETVEPILRNVLETGEAVEDVEIRGPDPTSPGVERVWLASYVPSVVGGEAHGVSVVVRDITERKRSEEAVREAKARLELAANAAHLGVFLRDLQTDRIEFDERCQELFEVPAGESLEVAFERVHPDDIPAVVAALDRALDPADPVDEYDSEHRLVLPSGTTRWMSVRAEAHFRGEGPDRTPATLIGVAQDITDRKRTEEALAETAARLEMALTGGGVGTYEVRLADGRVTFDESAQRLLGFEPETTLDATVERVHPDDRADVEARIATVTDPATPDDTVRSIHRQVHPDGTVIWVVLQGRCEFAGEGPDRTPVRLVGTVVDITELKEAQDAVRRQLAEIDAYFDAVPVGIAVYDRDGRYVRVNGRMEEILGRSTEEVVGRNPVEVVPKPHVEANRPLLRRVLHDGVPIRDVEMRLPAPADPDGPPLDWLASYVPLVQDGAVTGATLVVQDVTALKAAQAGLEALTAELEGRVVLRTAEVRRLVGDLTEAERRERGRVAQVLHDDLQQLLYATQFKIQALRSGAEQGRPLEAHFDSTEQLLDRAVHVTRTLTVDLRPPVLEGEGLDATFEWLAHRVQEAYGLEVTVEREGPVQAGKTVQVLLFQIVRELLFNVVKHAGTTEATIRVGRGEGGRVRVVVEDEGIGFETEDHEGIGLASVRERIRLVGGEIAVDSTPGEGTRVTIECPDAL